VKFSIEPWAPEYGTPMSPELDESTAKLDVDIEVPAGDWKPISPSIEPAQSLLFVDGVRRIDANIWIGDDQPTLGICATYAAGGVRSDGDAKLVAAEVRRGLFTPSPEAETVRTRHGSYEVRITAGSSNEDLWLGLQQRMGELEGEVSANRRDAELVITDGPLRTGKEAGTVGYVKTHHVQYLPTALMGVLTALRPGERTPLFLTTTAWSRFSWYQRLPGGGGGPLAGVVRCEATANQNVAAARTLADRVAVTLPRYASERHKDPRAPQNLYPIGGLERELRRRLGDQHLLYRALQVAAVGA